ncbi:MAG TPA: hypothetical protein VFN00_12940 [Arthrobacter sp.]|nr:hypothetical protein [Arthrobacter sp.]
MTELPPSTEDASAGDTSPGTADARVDWPERTADPNLPGDPAVAALLERLEALPELPVADHGEVYAGLHDALAEALNEDVAGEPRP